MSIATPSINHTTAIGQSRLSAQKAPGHWVLAQLGKRVLRPGGLHATRALIEALQIKKTDHVVEFAPGLGLTAEMIEAKWPAAYVGIDRDLPSVQQLQAKLASHFCRFVHAPCEATGLPGGSADKLIGEAMLSMHPEITKTNILAEAHRLIKTDGLYGLHELALTDEHLPDHERRRLRKNMSQVIHNGVTPLTTTEWCRLLRQQGFEPIQVCHIPFELLSPKRVLADEGLAGALRLAFNLIRNRPARKRVLAMRQVFRQYQQHLSAILIVARKSDGAAQ